MLTYLTAGLQAIGEIVALFQRGSGLFYELPERTVMDYADTHSLQGVRQGRLHKVLSI